MGNLDNSGAITIELGEYVHDFFALTRVQVSSGFVRQEEFGIADDSSCDTDELLVTA